jgi:hypothetical protein
LAAPRGRRAKSGFKAELREAAVEVGAEARMIGVPAPHPDFIHHRLSPSVAIPRRCAFAGAFAN